MKNQIQRFTLNERKRSDTLINYLLAVYYCIGLLLSLYYDTWDIGLGVGSICLLAFYCSKYLLPDSNYYQYVLSAVTGIFMAQFIYQTHGMFEMHFFAVLGSIIMITYRNWKLQLPLAVVVLLHHAAFGYLQFTGFDKIYFTQLEYMSLFTFIIHCTLTISIFTLSGLWAYNYKKSELRHIAQSFEIGKLQEVNKQKEAFIVLNENLSNSRNMLQHANQELEIIFNNIQAMLFSRDTSSGKFIHISAACEKIYGYTASEFMADENLWLQMVHPEDRLKSPVEIAGLLSKKTAFYTYRIIRKDKSIRWLETSLVPSGDSAGRIIRIDGICNDITERIQLEQKLSEEITLKQRQITSAVISAQEKERYFLGSELHDNINPVLATAKLYVDCVLSGDKRQYELLKDSKSFIGMAIDEIRKLCKALVPPSLGEIGLKEAICGMVDNLSVVNNLQYHTLIDDIDESLIDANLKLTIFRIVQEQLNNILKHAAAHIVWISLFQNEGLLQLTVKDDGVGFDVAKKRSGVGLQNIYSRTELCNGTVNILSSPGNGCQLIVTFAADPLFNCLQTGMKA